MFTPVDDDNPYQRSFLAFLRACVWTIDEARAGQVRPWPFEGGWEAYWTDWETALLCCSPLLIDKTRRTMASNTVTAFALWLLAGGQDGASVLASRWPELHLSTGNRLVMVQSRKLEDEGGAASFVDRMRRMERLMLEHGIRERWPSWPDFEWSFGTGRASNGSRVSSVPQGADQIRGPGATLIWMEELSFWGQAQKSVEAAIPALTGGGHLVAVTTPAAATFASRIRRGLTGRKG